MSGPAAPAPGLAALSEARAWLGTPYRHQASRRGAGCDCLGLIRGVWRALYGAEPEQPPPYSMDWDEAARAEALWQAAARHLSPLPPGAAWQPGDVLLFRMRAGSVAKHLGILGETSRRRAGGDDAATAMTFVHAYAGHGVVESALTPPWARRVVARFAWPGDTRIGKE